MRRHELTWAERWAIEEDARRQAIATTELAVFRMRRKLERDWLVGWCIGFALAVTAAALEARDNGRVNGQ